MRLTAIDLSLAGEAGVRDLRVDWVVLSGNSGDGLGQHVKGGVRGGVVGGILRYTPGIRSICHNCYILSH